MVCSVGDVVKTAAQRLREAGVESPQLDAQVLMARALRCSRLDVIAHPERVPTDSEAAEFSLMLQKRVDRWPLAYITGHREFYGLNIGVAPGVLVPRPETELLVEECLKRVGRRPAIVADIGAGSGAIAVALAASAPEWTVYSTEISPDALQVARANVEKHHLRDRVYLVEGDLLEPLRRLGLAFDAIVSNPPYIPSGEIESLQPEVRLYEPREALDGGPDGLDVYRRLFPESVDLLREGGFVAVEMGAGQDGAVVEIARRAGYREVEIIADLAGIGRVGVAYG